MSAPVITNISPGTGNTGGGFYVELTGTGFSDHVQVTFGGVPATSIQVWSSTLVACLAPAHAAGPVDVVVQNLDVEGAPVPGESATAVGGYAYALPELAPETDLARVVRTLLQQLKLQVLPNTVLTTSTDYDDSTTDQLSTPAVSQLPALVLEGPDLPEDRFFSKNEDTEVLVAPDVFETYRVPYTVNLKFTVVGMSETQMEKLNLANQVLRFFHRNHYLTMARDPADASKGTVRYEMDFDQDGGLRNTDVPNESNLRSFSGTIIIRGFDIEDGQALPGYGVGEDGITVVTSKTNIG